MHEAICGLAPALYGFFIAGSCYCISCLCAMLSGEIQNLWINRHLANKLKL